MPSNPIGTSLGQATAIPSSTAFRDRVSSRNPNDVFSFNLANPGVLGISFKSLGRSASLNLIQDRNQNGVVEAGEVLQTLSSKSKKVEKIDLADLALGTYYLQVSTDHSSSPYQLKLSAATGSFETKGAPSFVRQVVKLTNQFRTQNGLVPLRLNNKLNKAAQTHSQSMATQDFLVTRAKMDLRWAIASPGQAITGALWQRTLQRVNPPPMKSLRVGLTALGIEKNILNTTIKDIGVGYFFLSEDTGTTNYNAYWTQNFGKS